MRVLLTGATGFIGRHLAEALAGAGHHVIGLARRPPLAPEGASPHEWRAADLALLTSPESWCPWLDGVDVVVNAVGIMVEPASGPGFEVLHVRAPRALFEACRSAGVRRVIHLSALGADDQARSRYHLSKRAGDQALLALRDRGLEGVVLQPSLVFGLDGASAQFFLQLAVLPVLPVPSGAGDVQPVHVDDLGDLVVRLVEGAETASPVIPVVGPEALSWEGYLQRLRVSTGLSEAPVWRLPRRLVGWAVAVGQRLNLPLMNREAWQMLQRGNTGDVAALAGLLGRQPRSAVHFLRAHERSTAVIAARLPVGLGLLRASIAAVWLVTAVVSFGLYPVADSLALLGRVGVEGALARLMLYGASTLDLLLGAATLAWPRRLLWWAQVVLICAYTALITWKLPEYWLHPYGPILKNLPMLAALGLLIALEPARRR